MMLGDLMNELRGLRDEARYGQRTRVITVAKPFCAPARGIITGAFQPYGVKVYDIAETPMKISVLDFARRMRVEAKTWENLRYGPLAALFLPLATVAKIRVNESAAAWAEYLLLRTGKLYVPGQYVNRRNEQWAARHGGQMPAAWRDGKPWVEASCSEGVQAWQSVKGTLADADLL